MKEIFENEPYEIRISDTHILYVDVSSLDTDMVYPYISQYRKDKLNVMKNKNNKKLSLGCELLLIYAIKKYYPEIPLPLNICVGEYGKPYIQDTDIYFNLAHSGDVSVCAISKTDIGIDIEKTDRISDKIADKYFTDREKEFDFCHIWTRKEAAAKACGMGLGIGINTIDVSADTIEISGDTYNLYSFNADITGYYISLCVL